MEAVIGKQKAKMLNLQASFFCGPSGGQAQSSASTLIASAPEPAYGETSPLCHNSFSPTARPPTQIIASLQNTISWRFRCVGQEYAHPTSKTVITRAALCVLPMMR